MTFVDDSFWPKDISPDIRPPIAVLRPRAEELTAITNGILVGKVTSKEDENYLSHRLDVYVPTLDFSQRLLVVRHATGSVYPAFVEAASIPKKLVPFARMTDPARRPKADNEASTDNELAELLKVVLHSHHVRSLLASLIAQANLVIDGSPDVGIAAVRHNPHGNQIDFFRVHLPVAGHFGTAVTDARRESVIDMIQKQGKRVVTIRAVDERFVVAATVRVTSKQYLRIDENDEEKRDDLGDLPEIDQVRSRL